MTLEPTQSYVLERMGSEEAVGGHPRGTGEQNETNLELVTSRCTHPALQRNLKLDMKG